MKSREGMRQPIVATQFIGQAVRHIGLPNKLGGHNFT